MTIAIDAPSFWPRSVRMEPVHPQRRTGLGRDDIKILALVATGATAASIAVTSGTSERTLRRRIRAICDALDVRTPIEAVAWAARKGLI